MPPNIGQYILILPVQSWFLREINCFSRRQFPPPQSLHCGYESDCIWDSEITLLFGGEGEGVVQIGSGAGGRHTAGTGDEEGSE